MSEDKLEKLDNLDVVKDLDIGRDALMIKGITYSKGDILNIGAINTKKGKPPWFVWSPLISFLALVLLIIVYEPAIILMSKELFIVVIVLILSVFLIAFSNIISWIKGDRPKGVNNYSMQIKLKSGTYTFKSKDEMSIKKKHKGVKTLLGF